MGTFRVGLMKCKLYVGHSGIRNELTYPFVNISSGVIWAFSLPASSALAVWLDRVFNHCSPHALAKKKVCWMRRTSATVFARTEILRRARKIFRSCLSYLCDAWRMVRSVQSLCLENALKKKLFNDKMNYRKKNKLILNCNLNIMDEFTNDLRNIRHGRPSVCFRLLFLSIFVATFFSGRLLKFGLLKRRNIDTKERKIRIIKWK